MKTYKATSSFLLGNSVYFIFPFLLTLIVIAEGEAAQTNEWIGVSIFWLLGVLITFVPLGSTLEVGDDYIKTYLFGFTTTSKLNTADIQVVEYGNVFRGGLGFGKGISFRALRNGQSKAYSLSEKIYGKEAIAHARRVLDSTLSK